MVGVERVDVGVALKGWLQQPLASLVWLFQGTAELVTGPVFFSGYNVKKTIGLVHRYAWN